jgi:DNA-binding MarR family transcriptional regulator
MKQDSIKKLGELALGSRLKRLSDLIMRNGKEIYQEYKIDFEPKWFPVFFTLSENEEMGVVEIARSIGMKHPSVSQLIKEMQDSGLIDNGNNKLDARKRNLTLSKKGKVLLLKLKPIWADISTAIHEMTQAHTHNILCALEQFEDDFSSSSMLDRVNEQRKEQKRVDARNQQITLITVMMAVALMVLAGMYLVFAN